MLTIKRRFGAMSSGIDSRAPQAGWASRRRAARAGGSLGVRHEALIPGDPEEPGGTGAARAGRAAFQWCTVAAARAHGVGLTHLYGHALRVAGPATHRPLPRRSAAA